MEAIIIIYFTHYAFTYSIIKFVADDEDNRDEQALALLFADTLLKYLAKRKVKGTTNYKFDGTLDELKDFVSLVLKRKGKWTGKKNTRKQTFSDSKAKLTLSWWPTSKTLQLQGTNENVENFETKLDNLLESIQKINPTKNDDSTNLNEKSSTISAPEKNKRTKKPETHIQCDSREEGEVNSKQKSGEVWHAISQLKEQLLKLSQLVSGKTGTKTNNSDYEPSKRELLITSSNTENMSKVNNKGNIEKITYYFPVQALNLNSLILTSKTGYNTVASMAPHQASSQLAWCSTRLYPRSFIISNLYE